MRWGTARMFTPKYEGFDNQQTPDKCPRRVGSQLSCPLRCATTASLECTNAGFGKCVLLQRHEMLAAC